MTKVAIVLFILATGSLVVYIGAIYAAAAAIRSGDFKKVRVHNWPIVLAVVLAIVGVVLL